MWRVPMMLRARRFRLIRIVLSLVNMEEDRAAKQQEPFVRTDTGVTYKSPPLYLNKSNLDDAFCGALTR